jgi:3',5'-cyclic AMP phosphodiesterase CpdA
LARAVAAAPAARDADPDASDNSPACHLLAVGDFGVKRKDLERQQAVSDGMTKYLAARRIRPDALLLLGDNFYGGLGGKGVNSSRWDLNVESMYPAGVFPGPMYAVLGNHDYNDEKGHASVNAQLAYARREPRPRWTMPDRWYRFDVAAPRRSGPLATFLALDTNFVYRDRDWVTPDERKRQMKWLRAELERPRVAPWLFVIGHHPVYSNGKHGDSEALVNGLDPLLRKHRVDLYLSGHDHDLQHLEFDGHPTSFVVSGGGGARARDLRSRKRGPFGRAVYGFTHLEVRRERVTVRHLDANGTELHAFTRIRAGRIAVGSGA